MGRSRYTITEPDKPHFLTCTLMEWLPLFIRPYIVDHLLLEMLLHARRLGLRCHRSERTTKRAAEVMLTVQTKRFLREGHHKLAL